jgi:hypothetical protein
VGRECGDVGWAQARIVRSLHGNHLEVAPPNSPPPFGVLGVVASHEEVGPTRKRRNLGYEKSPNLAEKPLGLVATASP